MKNIPNYSLCVLLLLAANASAQSTPSTDASTSGMKYTLQLSPYSFHWRKKEPEDRNVYLVGIEREHSNGKIDGLAYFSNSFGQDSAYLFPWGGVYKNIYGIPKLSFKWTAGIIYGYKPPFEDKIPFNVKGFAPAVIPALSYEFRPGWSGQVNMLGVRGFMFQLNAPLN